MADVKNLAQAKSVYDAFCRTLDSEDWRYKKNDEKLTISCGARGEDLPIELEIIIDADRMLVMVLSHMPFVVQEDKRLDVAIAVSAINNALVDGCFDYNIADGHMFFRMTNSFIESQLGADLFKYLVYCSCQTIDEYNDKLLMVAKGMISIEQFLKSLGN